METKSLQMADVHIIEHRFTYSYVSWNSSVITDTCYVQLTDSSIFSVVFLTTQQQKHADYRGWNSVELY
jgi:hypothetical protein